MTEAAPTAPLTVQLISAPWCKRCAVLKPDVEALCKTVGARMDVVDYDELDEGDPLKKSVTALPSILMAGRIYTPAQITEWRDALMGAATVVVTGDTDF